MNGYRRPMMRYSALSWKPLVGANQPLRRIDLRCRWELDRAVRSTPGFPWKQAGCSASSAAVWLPYAPSDLPQGLGIDPERAAGFLEIVTELEFPSQQGRQVAGLDARGVLVRLPQHLARVV